MSPRQQLLLIGVLSFSAAVATLPTVGITDDDDFYQHAGHAYVRWGKKLLTQPTQALRRTQIDAHFSHNREHPPLAKYLIGAGRLLGHDLLGWWSSPQASRLGICAMLALAIMVTFGLTYARAGPLAAWFAGLALLLFPRFAFHGRVPTLDMTVAATTSAFLLCFWHLHRKPGWRAPVIMGLVFGLALASKLNAPFALIGCGLYWLTQNLWTTTKQSDGLRLPVVPLWMIVVPSVGFAVQIALWPHMWTDTISRYGAYVSFHTKHYPIYLFYEGQIWDRPFAPWHAPFKLAWAALPTLTLVSGLVGLAALIGRFGRQDEDGRFARFLLIHAVVAIGTVAFSPVPKYGGVKLFLPFFPQFAVAAGIGFIQLRQALAQVVHQRFGSAAWGVALAAVMLSTGLIDTVRFSGHELSSYGHHVGGLPGAVTRGFERQYYDVLDPSLTRWLNEQPASARVHFEPNHKEYVRSAPYMIRRGDLRPDLRLSHAQSAEIVILTHERRWRTFSDLALTLSGRPVLHQHEVDGVVLWTAYGKK